VTQISQKFSSHEFSILSRLKYHSLHQTNFLQTYVTPVSQTFSPHEFSILTRLRYRRRLHHINYPQTYVTQISQNPTVPSDALEFLSKKKLSVLFFIEYEKIS
jgi:hypothetical protein